MPLYQYTAMDAAGKEKTGTLEAVNQEAVTKALKEQGMFPTSVKPAVAGKGGKGPGAAAGGNKKSVLSMNISLGPARITGKDLTVITRQLSILLEAGLPLVRALRTLERQAKDPGVRKILGKVATSVEGGSGFSEALSQFPGSFNNLYINMVRAGEASGKLDLILGRLAMFREKADKIAAKVKSAMTYPIIVLSIAVLMTVGLMIFVVPKFQDMFTDMLGGAELPLMTQIVIEISQFFQENWLVGLVLLVGIPLAINLLNKTKGGKYAIDWLKYHMPLFGDLIRKNAVSSFARTLGTLTGSAVPALDALRIVRDTASNEVVAHAVQQIHDAVKEGEPMSSTMASTKVFPEMVVSMVEVGEETAKTPEMLEKIADTYDDEVDNAVASLTSMIEPLLMVFLAVVVGGVVIALFMPLIKIVENFGAQ